MDENKKRICAYVRVSTNTADQENSYNNQYEYFSNAITNAGHIFAGIYADKGLTGTKLTRPEFDRMIIDAGIDILKLYSNNSDKRKSKQHIVYEISDREPKFDEVWVKNSSRFARNTLSYEIIEKLKHKGVNIFFTDYAINTNDDSAILALKMLQVIDEQDSRDKSKKVKWGVERGAENNIIRTTSTIYGYKYYPRPENRLEIIEKEAEVIKKIYELYSKGFGFRRIVNYLKDNKIYTRQGKPFVQNTIKSILSNEKYYGGNPILKYDSGEVFNKRTFAIPKENYEVRENDRIPSIISKELFNQCQKIREKNTNRGNKKGVFKGTTKYANMLVCGKCHSFYTANTDKGRKFYNCRTKKMYGTKACDNENISVTKLEKLITSKEYNEKIGFLKNKIIFSLNKWIDNIEAKRDKNCQTEIKMLELEKQELSNNISNLIKQSSISINDDVRKIINLEMENIVIQINKIDEKIKTLNNWNAHIDNSIQDIEQIKEEIKSIELKEQYTEQELFDQIYKIVIINSNSILIYYKLEKKLAELTKKYDTKELNLFPYMTLFYDMFNI